MDSVSQLKPESPLVRQLLERMATMRRRTGAPVEVETEAQRFKRVYDDPSAWTTVSSKERSILPR